MQNYQNYKDFFKGKKITIMGLGLLGRGLGYTKFLAECGADLIVTDLKTKEQLATSLKKLNKFNNIKFVLGEHRLEDFRGRDMIIKSAGVPLDSPYIKEANRNKILVEMDVSLFVKFAPQIKVIGVTGTRGKSMTTMLIHHILTENIKDKQIFLGGNIRGVATLPFLKKIKENDILVAELDSWQLQGFGPTSLKLHGVKDAGFSPLISVFTSFMPDHMNYYKNSMQKYFADKANIFKYQKRGDVLVIGETMQKLIRKNDTKGKLIVAKKTEVADWKFIVPGEHSRANLACAVLVCQEMGLSIEQIKKSVANFKGVEGRLQFLREYKGIKIYNDNNATTPEATIAGIKAFVSLSGVRPPTIQGSDSRQLVLICGGADKKLDLKNFVKEINKNCKFISLIPGTGTDELLKNKLKTEVYKAKDFKDAVISAVKYAKRGDIILFSPAFASFGLFANEYERNDLFIDIIKKLK